MCRWVEAPRGPLPGCWGPGHTLHGSLLRTGLDCGRTRPWFHESKRASLMTITFRQVSVRQASPSRRRDRERGIKVADPERYTRGRHLAGTSIHQSFRCYKMVEHLLCVHRGYKTESTQPFSREETGPEVGVVSAGCLASIAPGCAQRGGRADRRAGGVRLQGRVGRGTPLQRWGGEL